MKDYLRQLLLDHDGFLWMELVLNLFDSNWAVVCVRPSLTHTHLFRLS